MDEATEMFELAEMAKNFTIKDKQLLEPIVTDIWAKIGQFKADIETRSSSSWLLSGLSQLQAVKEGLRLVETEREAVLEKFAILESWRKMQMSALKANRKELFTLFERLEGNVKEKKVMLPLLIALKCMLVENGSLTEDETGFLRLYKEYVEMRTETIKMKIKTNETNPRCALAFLNKSL